MNLALPLISFLTFLLMRTLTIKAVLFFLCCRIQYKLHVGNFFKPISLQPILQLFRHVSLCGEPKLTFAGHLAWYPKANEFTHRCKLAWCSFGAAQTTPVWTSSFHRLRASLSTYQSWFMCYQLILYHQQF